MLIVRLLAVVAALTLATATGLLEASTAAPISASAADGLAKKRCHFVKKKVHGKIRRVRVCTNPKQKPAPKQTAVAKKLVVNLSRAKTPAARYQSILAILRALHLGVVTPAGKPVSVSPEPNAGRLFQLYDFEVRGLSAQLARGQTTSLDDLAVALKRGGLGLDGDRPLPAALLAEGLRDAARQALAQPKPAGSLLPLVVRELGLRHGYDTSQDVPPAQIKLDTLQAWLITADMTLPVLREALLPAKRALSTTSDLPGACSKYAEAAQALQAKIEKTLGGNLQKWIADQAAGRIYDKVADKLKREATRWAIKNMPRWAVRGAYQVGQAASVVGPIIDLIHGALLAYSIDVRSLEDSLAPIHWWHSVGEGTTLTFRIKVTMLDDYGDTAVKCGTLLGSTYPEREASRTSGPSGSRRRETSASKGSSTASRFRLSGRACRRPETTESPPWCSPRTSNRCRG